MRPASRASPRRDERGAGKERGEHETDGGVGEAAVGERIAECVVRMLVVGGELDHAAQLALVNGDRVRLVPSPVQDARDQPVLA